MSKSMKRVALSLTTVITCMGIASASYAAPEKPTEKMSAPAPDGQIPPPTLDTNDDGKPDAWDRDANGVADAWDVDGDGKPDKLDNDGDGKPDDSKSSPKPEPKPQR